MGSEYGIFGAVVFGGKDEWDAMVGDASEFIRAIRSMLATTARTECRALP